MSAAVTESELFAALRGYASALEVQFMIEQELKKFQEKTLPRLIAEAAESDTSSLRAGAGAGASAPSPRGTDKTSAAAATSPAKGSSGGPSSSSAAHHAMPDPEWVQTFLKAHIDDTVARRLPTMIAQEVQRQLRSASAAAPSSSPSYASPPALQRQTDGPSASTAAHSNGTAPSGSAGSGGGVDGLRAAMGLPPLPPPAPAAAAAVASSSSLPFSSGASSPREAQAMAAAAAAESNGGPASNEAASAEPERPARSDENTKDGEGSSSGGDRRRSSAQHGTTVDEGRRQREMILAAINDVERQVNALQHAVDQATDADSARVRRWVYLCDVLECKTRSAASLPPRPLQTHLARLLDEQQGDALVATLQAVLQSLLAPAEKTAPAREGGDVRVPALPRGGDGVGGVVQPTQGSASRSPPATERVLEAEYGPLSQGREERSDDEPPSPLPTAPISSAAGSRHGATAGAAAAAAVAAPPPSLVLASGSGSGSHATAAKPVRSITTKGAAAGSALPPASQPPDTSVPRTATDSRSSSAAAGVDAGAGLAAPFDSRDGDAGRDAAQQGRDGSPRPTGLEGTAVRRPSPALQDCVDAAAGQRLSDPLREPRTVAGRQPQQPHAHSALAPTTTTTTAAAGGGGRRASAASAMDASASLPHPLAGLSPRPIVLGIDAVNVPPGVLPDALGSHGAVRIQSVGHRQLAAQAGLCKGDILLSLDQRRVHSCEQLRDVLRAVPATQSAITVELYRHSAHQIITVLLKL